LIILIIIFGVLTVLAGTAILVDPEIIFGFLKKHIEKAELQVLAVVVRLALGVLLVYQADASGYPLAIEIIGWLSIVAAVFLALIGRNNFKRLMSWALSLEKPFGRIGGFIAACFGSFLVHAFI
jgi:hypothetical protein